MAAAAAVFSATERDAVSVAKNGSKLTVLGVLCTTADQLPGPSAFLALTCTSQAFSASEVTVWSSVDGWAASVTSVHSESWRSVASAAM